MHVDAVVGVYETVPEGRLEHLMAFFLVLEKTGIRASNVNYVANRQRQVAGSSMYWLCHLQ